MAHLLSDMQPSGGSCVLDDDGCHAATLGCCMLHETLACDCVARQRCLSATLKDVMNHSLMVCGELRAATTKYSS